MNNIMRSLIILVGGVVVILILRAFKNRGGGGNVLHRNYLCQLAELAILAVCVMQIIALFNPEFNLRRALLTGSALIVAIVGFAAQTAISDVICGLLISMSKPFEIGDRIIVDGLEPGIVEDITLRHIVVAIYDGLKIVVPNSQLNSKTVINYSYKDKFKNGVHLQYTIGFDANVQQASDVIRDCVAESPYTLSIERNGFREDSGPVYFLKLGESALVLETTIFVPKGTSTYMATTDINTRVVEAFRANNIQIPYNYINVVDAGKIGEGVKEKQKTSTIVNDEKLTPEKRHYRTNNLKLVGSDNDVDKVKALADHFSKKQRLRKHDSHKLELMAEESISLFSTLIQGSIASFWIEGSGFEFRIHLSINTKVGSKEYKRLIALSSTRRNEAISGFASRIFDAMVRGIQSAEKSDNNQKYEWDIDRDDVPQNELSESILAALASGIKVGVTKEKVEFVVEKKN
ncbi:mechanosensitive ion channel family protein [Butyrivibrio sp. JL13D10]|uniref:mechanosensitive ion channel family protein n=1 Tax=Butyrivibrio sp. JL13D10 TaxID=3236815 RepID=UPI0038B68AB7